MGQRRSRTLILHLCRGALSILLVCCAGLSFADPLPDWTISGSNTLRGEYYDVDGDAASAPYPYTGSQFYDELDLGLDRRVSPWERVRIQLSGVLNDSDYRSNERGGVLERFSLFWEKGDGALPFRLQAGDYYAAQSPLTVQRGLKGAQLELQPWAGHSIQLFSGLSAPIYRDLDADQGVFSGLSWLVEDQTLGALNLSAVHFGRSRNSTQVGLDQDVFSLGWYKLFELGRHEIELESELAHFSGEYDDRGTSDDGDDQGLFAELSGRARPLDYRLRYERYGEHFRPAGGSIIPDHRGVEGHLGWRFASGLQLRGRLQSYRDALESSNPLDTRTAGIALTGPLSSGSAVHGSLDAFVQDREDRDDTLDSETHSISLNLSAPLTRQLTLRGGAAWTGTDDRINDSRPISRQQNLALDAAFIVAGWRGTASPGLVLRRITGGSDSTEISPTLALQMSRGAHDLRFSHNWLIQDGHTSRSVDSDIHQTALAYVYRTGRHTLGLEANYFDRDPDSGADTEAYRLAAFWTYTFHRPARTTLAGPVARPEGADPAGQPTLLDLQPGLSLAGVQQRLARNSLTPAYRLPGMEIYQAPLLEEISLRQRFALLHDGGDLERTALVLDFEDLGNPDGMARDYARVSDSLIKLYGAPEDYQEEGSFGPNLGIDLALGRFERRLEWRTDAGHIRFGIPQRLDGQVRMEICYAATLPSAPTWSVEALR